MLVRYSQDHQYIIVEDGVGTVGITNHAQQKLSDVTLVELPHVGEQVKKGGAVGVVESVKADAVEDYATPRNSENSKSQQDRNYERSRGIWTNLFGGSKKNSEENSEK
jgi:hypothetical protein